MRRVAKWIGLGLLALFLLLAGGLAWLNTAGGLRTLAQLAEKQLTGLRIEGLRGPLPGRLSVEHLALADAEGEWLRLDDVQLALNLPALLHRQLRIQMLTAASMALERLPATSAPQETAPKPGGPLLPQVPHLPVDVVLDRLAVGRIALGAPVLGQAAAFSLEGRAAAQNGRLQGQLALDRLDAPGQVALLLALAPGDRLEADIKAEDPAGGLLPKLAGMPDRPLSLALHLAGPADGADLSLQASLGEGVSARLGGTISADTKGGVAARLSGEARTAPLLPAELAPLAMPLQFTLDFALSTDRQFALQNLSLKVPGGEAQAQGEVNLGTEAVDLALTLNLPASGPYAGLLPAGLGWRAISAEARVTGTLSGPHLAMEAQPQGLATGTPALDAALGPAPKLNLRLALPEQDIDLHVTGADAGLALTGRAGEQLDLNGRLRLPRLGALGPGFDGSAELTVAARGPRSDPDVTLHASSDRLVAAGQVLEAFALDARVTRPLTRPDAEATASGRYAGLPLSLNLRARPEGQEVKLDRTEASFGPARLRAEGSLALDSHLFTGGARLEVSDLAPFARLANQPGLAGKLSLDAQLRPRDGTQGVTLRLEAPSLAVAGQSGSLRLQAEGTPAEIGFSFIGQTAEARLAAQGRAGTNPDGWRLELARLEANALGDTVRLAAPARIGSAPEGGIDIGALALTTGRGGRLEARGRWGPERVDLSATLSALPLALAQAAMPNLPVSGRLDGELRVTGPVARPDAELRLTAGGIRVDQPPLAALPPANLRLEARLAAGAATAQAQLEAGSLGPLRASASLPEGSAGPLNATLDGTLDLAPLARAFLAGGADRVSGRLELALRAGGTLVAPVLGGRATLANISYRNLAYGVALNSINGTIVGNGSNLRLEGVTARTEGGGRINLSGTLDPTVPGMPADLVLTARGARPVSSDLLTATLDADLRLTGPLTGGASASGEVTVTRADIRVPESLPGSVATLSDVRQRGPLPPGRRPPPPPAAPAAAAAPIGLALQVTVRRAFIRGRGLDAVLGGKLNITGTSAAPVVSGGLDLDNGTLDVLARRLTFQRGAITFASGTLVPQLDFAATSTVGSTAITVSVTGTPQAPKVGFSSVPELPQDEILAQLIFGRSTSKLSPFEIAQLAEALAQLTGTGGTGGITDRLRSGLGLDRLGVTSDPTRSNAAAVEAGRYVAPGVYLGVRQGTSGNTGVTGQVEITPRLKLEGQTATGPAGDRLGLTYEFEY